MRTNIDVIMAKGNSVCLENNESTSTKRMAEGGRTTFDEGDSMNVEFPDLKSLSLSDLEIIPGGKCHPFDMERCESGIESENFHQTIVNHDINRISGSPSSGTVSPWADEGYNSRSINRLPVQQTKNNELVSPMSSLDVVSVFSQDKDGDTNLHIAIIQGNIQMVMLIISSAPNSEWLNISNLLLQTPLHLAVITKQKNIVRRLMVAGARVDCTDIHGNTPLHIACRKGYDDIVECLLRPVFYEETHLNRYEIPYQRIPQDLNTRNYNGHMCLHLASMSTHLKVLDLLLSKGADVNCKDGTSGRTILHYAAETGNRILLHFLLSQRKLNISCRTFGGLTPLRLAAGRGYGDVVSILLANGADVMDMNDSDEDVLDDFCINGQPIVI